MILLDKLNWNSLRALWISLFLKNTQYCIALRKSRPTKVYFYILIACIYVVFPPRLSLALPINEMKKRKHFPFIDVSLWRTIDEHKQHKYNQTHDIKTVFRGKSARFRPSFGAKFF